MRFYSGADRLDPPDQKAAEDYDGCLYDLAGELVAEIQSALPFHFNQSFFDYWMCERSEEEEWAWQLWDKLDLTDDHLCAWQCIANYSSPQNTGSRQKDNQIASQWEKMEKVFEKRNDD